MKAIVIGVRAGRAALLLEDGTTTYRRMKCSPGERVEIPDQTNIIQSAPLAAKVAAAAVIAVSLVGGGYYETMVPVSYVTVDAASSTEYSLNRMDMVMETKVLNDETAAAEDMASANGKSISDALRKAGDEVENEDNTDGDGYILLSVNSDTGKREKKLEEKLSKTMEPLKESGIGYSILSVSEDERRMAKELSMSSGRYKKMLDDSKDEEFDEEMISEYKRRPVNDLMNTRAPEDKPVIDADKAQETPKDTDINIINTDTTEEEAPSQNIDEVPEQNAIEKPIQTPDNDSTPQIDRALVEEAVPDNTYEPAEESLPAEEPVPEQPVSQPPDNGMDPGMEQPPEEAPAPEEPDPDSRIEQQDKGKARNNKPEKPDKADKAGNHEEEPAEPDREMSFDDGGDRSGDHGPSPDDHMNGGGGGPMP